jgi:hypothetical protein
MWIITHAPQHGRDPTRNDCSTISSGRVSVRMLCSKATSGSSTHRYFEIATVGILFYLTVVTSHLMLVGLTCKTFTWNEQCICQL